MVNSASWYFDHGVNIPETPILPGAKQFLLTYSVHEVRTRDARETTEPFRPAHLSTANARLIVRQIVGGFVQTAPSVLLSHRCRACCASGATTPCAYEPVTW